MGLSHNLQDEDWMFVQPVAGINEALGSQPCTDPYLAAASEATNVTSCSEPSHLSISQTNSLQILSSTNQIAPGRSSQS